MHDVVCMNILMYWYIDILIIRYILYWYTDIRYTALLIYSYADTHTLIYSYNLVHTSLAELLNHSLTRSLINYSLAHLLTHSLTNFIYLPMGVVYIELAKKTKPIDKLVWNMALTNKKREAFLIRLEYLNIYYENLST